MLLSAFEKLCTYYLETTLTNAEFVIYHFSRRKQWKIVDAMEIKDACIQHVHDDLGLNIHCQLVGNLTTKNKPIQGYCNKLFNLRHCVYLIDNIWRILEKWPFNRWNYLIYLARF